MHKKQFFLLSLIICTLSTEPTLQGSAPKIRTLRANFLTSVGLLAGGYAGSISIIGTNNKNRPVLNDEAYLPTELRNQREHQRQNPYQAAFEETNSMIVDECAHVAKTVNDASIALKKASQDAYFVLVTEAHNAFKKAKGTDSEKISKPTTTNDSNAEDNK